MSDWFDDPLAFMAAASLAAGMVAAFFAAFVVTSTKFDFSEDVDGGDR